MAKVIFVTLATLALASCAFAYELDPETDLKCPIEQIEKMDQMVQKILSFNEKQRAFPETHRNISKYCK